MDDDLDEEELIARLTTLLKPMDIPKQQKHFGPHRYVYSGPRDDNPRPVPYPKPTHREPYKIKTEQPGYEPPTFLGCTFDHITQSCDMPVHEWRYPEIIKTEVSKKDLEACDYNPKDIKELFDVGAHTWDTVHGLLGRFAEGKKPNLESKEIVPCSPPKKPFYPKSQWG